MLNVPRSKLLAVTLAGLLAWGISALIVTDKEAIEAVAEAMSAEILAGEWESLEGHLHEEFKYGGMSRGKTVAYLKQLAEQHGPNEVAVTFEAIEVTDDRAKAKGWIRARTVSTGERFAQVQFDARLVRSDDGWLLMEIVGASPVVPSGLRR
jgi:hypothetical protein